MRKHLFAALGVFVLLAMVASSSARAGPAVVTGNEAIAQSAQGAGILASAPAAIAPEVILFEPIVSGRAVLASKAPTTATGRGMERASSTLKCPILSASVLIAGKKRAQGGAVRV